MRPISPFNYLIKSNAETVSKWGLFSFYIKGERDGNRKEIFSKKHKSLRLKQL